MHQPFMINGHYMNNIQLFMCEISPKYTTVMTNYRHKYLFWHTVTGVYQCTPWFAKPCGVPVLCFHTKIQNIPKLHGAKYYFSCISITWYLITLPDMNKMNPFFSEIAQQIHKMYEKVAIINSNWAHRERDTISQA